MRIDVAIKHQECIKEEAERRGMPYRVEAADLAIEALKRVKEQHHSRERDYYALLPGETEE